MIFKKLGKDDILLDSNLVYVYFMEGLDNCITYFFLEKDIFLQNDTLIPFELKDGNFIKGQVVDTMTINSLLNINDFLSIFSLDEMKKTFYTKEQLVEIIDVSKYSIRFLDGNYDLFLNTVHRVAKQMVILNLENNIVVDFDEYVNNLILSIKLNWLKSGTSVFTMQAKDAVTIIADINGTITIYDENKLMEVINISPEERRIR